MTTEELLDEAVEVLGEVMSMINDMPCSAEDFLGEEITERKKEFYRNYREFKRESNQG